MIAALGGQLSSAPLVWTCVEFAELARWKSLRRVGICLSGSYGCSRDWPEMVSVVRPRTATKMPRRTKHQRQT
jgi:hypothetical protein